MSRSAHAHDLDDRRAPRMSSTTPNAPPPRPQVAHIDVRGIRALCERVLRRNWREGVRGSDGVRFAYTRPSVERYPFQWFWDSCFCAIVWRRFDSARGRAELESLLAAQREDGFIGHTIFWDVPLDLRQRLTYNVLSADAPMTASIEPPLLAWAWSIAVGDPGSVPAIAAQHRWLAANRDLDGDGLLWIVQPDESGLDASPQFDEIWGWRAHSRAGFPLLVRRNRRLGYDLARVLAAGGPVCCEVMLNVIYSLSRAAMGEPSLTPVIVERMYDEQAGLFRPIARPRPPVHPAVTWAALSPLALPDLPEAIGRRLVDEHLLDREQFLLPFAPPSVSAAERSFSRRDSTLGIKRYWRGPTWMNAAWLLWMGLLRLGYHEQAGMLAARLGEAVATEGLHEYYDPYSGRAMGAVDLGWTSLIIEMLEPDARARSSFLTTHAATDRGTTGA
jgi:Mannosylglycerate hydrolase MGH1-like glycoside hydrolase domain